MSRWSSRTRQVVCQRGVVPVRRPPTWPAIGVCGLVSRLCGRRSRWEHVFPRCRVAGGFSGLEITRKIEGPKKVDRVLEMHGTAWIGLPWLPEDPHLMPHLTRHWMLNAVPLPFPISISPFLQVYEQASLSASGKLPFDTYGVTLNLTAGTSKQTHTSHWKTVETLAVLGALAN